MSIGEWRYEWNIFTANLPQLAMMRDMKFRGYSLARLIKLESDHASLPWWSQIAPQSNLLCLSEGVELPGQNSGIYCTPNAYELQTPSWRRTW